MKNKLLVLDFDGTLFPNRFRDLPNNGADPVLVHFLNKASEFGYRIVISSLAAANGREFCQDELNKAGVITPLADDDYWSIISHPKVNKSLPRPQLIEEFLTLACRLDLDDEDTEVLIFEDSFSPTVALGPYWIDSDENDGIGIHYVNYLRGHFSQ